MQPIDLQDMFQATIRYTVELHLYTSNCEGTRSDTTRLTVAYRLVEDSARLIAAVEARGFYEDNNGNTSIVASLRSLERATHGEGCTIGVSRYKVGGKSLA